MKVIYGVDRHHRPACWLVPENIVSRHKRSFMMDRASRRGEICGFPVSPVRNADGLLTGDVGVELPMGLSLDELVFLGSTLDGYASQMSEYTH